MTTIVQQPTSCVAVFERQPYWGPELKRQFVDRRVIVRDCRALRDLLPSVHEYSAAVNVMALDAAPADCLTWLANHFSGHGRTPCLIIGSAEFGDLEWLIREAGGIFVNEDVPRPRLAKMCLRRLQSSTTRDLHSVVGPVT